MKTATLKLMRTMLALAGAGLLTIALSSCGKKGNSDDPQITCPTGTAYQQNNVCYDAYGNVMGGAGNLDLGYISANFQTGYSAPTLQVTDMGAYRVFLKEALGVCDRGNNGYSFYGIYNCNAWVSGSLQVVMQTQTAGQGGYASMTFWAYPYTNQNYWYGAQLPSIRDFFKGLIGFPVISNVGAYRNPLVLPNMVVSLINNSQGIEARSYGAYDTTANIGLIQMQVMTGKLQDQTLSYKLSYKGKTFATGTFNRCWNNSCQSN